MDRKHTDSRYNDFAMSNIPASRASVHHIREAKPNPLGPRTFIPANRSQDPIDFVRATDVQRFGRRFQLPPLACYHYSLYREKPYSFYFEPLSNSRTSKMLNPGTLEIPDKDKPISVSRLPIFSLPEVCVQRVLFYLNDSDLAALGLVDRDCLQLSRARRFRSVCINYSTASMALLEKLVDEGCDRVANMYSYDKPKWTLGACISCIRVGPESDSQTNKPTSWIESRRQNYDAVGYHQRHMNFLELALRVALPNLEFLDWWERIPLSPIVAHAIIQSKITTLELHGVTLGEDFNFCGTTERERQSIDIHKWHLRRLVLDVTTNWWSSSSCAPIFTASLLKLVAPTLEELIWNGKLFTNHEEEESHSFGTDSVSFKKLKKLHMISVPLKDDTVMTALLPPNVKLKLTHLLFETPQRELAPRFANRHIPTLKHLTWSTVAPFNDIDMFISFVRANPQLETFRTEDTTVKLLDDHLIPLFASTFLHLTSLAFVFDTAEIEPASLALIGTIATLKRLWLSAGVQSAISLDWHVDHDSLRENLSPLKQLEWFALTLDLYPNGNKYSMYQHPRKTQKWENGHSRLMARHAMEFAKSHPKLTWVYFGEVPMEVERAEDGTGEVVDAVPLVQQRADCESLLKEMW